MAVRRSNEFLLGDPLRAAAALGVLTIHAVVISQVNVGGLSAAQAVDYGPHVRRDFGLLGSLGIAAGGGLYIFFALSGYLIGRPFVAFVLGDRRRPRLGRYVSRRLLRIVPAFWVAALATLLVFPDPRPSVGQIAAVFGFAQSYHPSGFSEHIPQAWTLSAEMLFYVLMPIAMFSVAALLRKRSRRPGRIAMIVAGAVAVSAGSIALFRQDPYNASHIQIFPVVVGYFASGVALAALEPAVEPVSFARRTPPWLAPALAIVGVALFLAWGFGIGGYLSGPPLVTLAAGLILGGCLVAQWTGVRPWRLLDNRLMHAVGRRSYSIYLLHYGVMLQLTAWLGGLTTSHPMRRLAVIGPLSLIGTLILAEISYRLVERPFLALQPAGNQPPVLSSPPVGSRARS